MHRNLHRQNLFNNIRSDLILSHQSSLKQGYVSLLLGTGCSSQSFEIMICDYHVPVYLIR